MTNAALTIRGISAYFGAFAALSDVSFDIAQGEKVGIIGPNGCGKTTLINCISGLVSVRGGEIAFNGRDLTQLEPHERTRLGVARSFQIPRPFRRMSVVENIYVPLQYVGGHHDGDPRAKALEYLDLLRLSDKADEHCSALTQVDLRKLELARALACDPKLLLVDEAMAGLSSAEVDEILNLLEHLAARQITIVMVEHIMHAITSFSSRILCFVAGKLVADGIPGEVIAHPEVRRAYLGD